MPEQNVELSHSGIKISYLRFLSDSATGQIVILTVIASYYLPLFRSPLRPALGIAASTEIKVLVAVLLVLLASPLGLAINATSWFLLSWLQIWLQKMWLLKRFPLMKSLREEFQTDLMVEYFSLSESNWYSRSRFIKQTLHLYQPYVVNRIDHIRGIRTFFRNLALLILIYCIVRLLIDMRAGSYDFGIFVILGLIFLFTIPMIIGSLLAFHYTSHVLYMSYILMVKSGRQYVLDENFERDVVAALSGDLETNSSS